MELDRIGLHLIFFLISSKSGHFNLTACGSTDEHFGIYLGGGG